MNKQAALQLVQAPKSPKAKRPTKAEIISKLESKLQEQAEQAEHNQQRLENEVASLTAQVNKLENPEESEVVEAAKKAFRKTSRVAAVIGLLVGASAPICSWWVSHYEIQGDWNTPRNMVLIGLVIGALGFSFPNVYKWMHCAFRSKPEAFGITLLLEGVMLFVHADWLTYSILALLIGINSIQGASNLTTRVKKPEFDF